MYYRTLLSLCIGLIVCYVTCYFYQTMVIHPEIKGSGWLELMVQVIYNSDMPYNCLPSIHVLTSYLMFRSAYVFQPVARHVIRCLAVLIIVSTLFVKQHVVVDVFAGWLAAEITYWVAGFSLPVMAQYRMTFRKRRQEHL
ncbi:serine/threonine protein phosphatase [Paenibacillus mendelii]|uniref:Serine/threonine protein phosphatase n=1 Tax=Paenibacillus mendelii TaxID=206163 RepID=A0ABV6JE02_9BACL|nr:serine/threonine protein phosphatase [Paenibacillus mendelii]MCQ6563396.1 serine/threonine protein phosphatase [Paenibacillus mendelii]